MMKYAVIMLSAALGAAPAAAQSTGTAAPPALGGKVEIPVDEARVFAVPSGVSTVVIGNPAITDVVFTLDRQGAIFTGRSFGATNVLFLAESGDTVKSAQVRVVRAPGLLTVTHGDKRATFACDPRCAPTQSIGDAPEVTIPIGAQVQERTNAAAAAAR